MVGVFGAGMTIHFSLKDLGPSAEISGTVSDSPDWIYGLSLGGPELSSMFVLGSSETNCRIID